jgi:acyl CoA:acetate/3-ketoacid CoA transferase
VRVIRDGDTIATGGFVGIGFAEELGIEFEKYFLSHQKPRDAKNKKMLNHSRQLSLRHGILPPSSAHQVNRYSG